MTLVRSSIANIPPENIPIGWLSNFDYQNLILAVSDLDSKINDIIEVQSNQSIFLFTTYYLSTQVTFYHFYTLIIGASYHI